MVLMYEDKDPDELLIFRRMNFLLNITKMGFECEVAKSLLSIKFCFKKIHSLIYLFYGIL